MKGIPLFAGDEMIRRMSDTWQMIGPQKSESEPFDWRKALKRCLWGWLVYNAAYNLGVLVYHLWP